MLLTHIILITSLKSIHISPQLQMKRASQVALVVKNPPANTGDTRDVSLIPGSGRFLGSRKWHPTPVFLPGKFHGQRGLEGCKESDMTERTRNHR